MKIGILRGLLPRDAQLEFSKSFAKFKSVFLTDEKLGRKNIYFFDPVKIFFGKFRHQSWVGIDIKKLEKVSTNLDILETYELYHFFSAQAAQVCKKLNIPLVTEVWTSFRHLAYYLPPYSWTTQKVISNTSLFIARSNRAQNALIKLGISKNKIKMIYQGVDLGKFFPRNAKKANAKKINFLYVGEMEKYKGVNIILKAWKIYHKKHMDSMLWMVGGGRIRPKGDGIKYLGYVDHSKLPEIYRSADVFLAPSINRYIGPFLWWEEFFSYTLMEAMACGLSIIGSNSGGVPEEIGNKNIIVRQNSVDDLVSAMEKVKVKNSNRKRAEKYFDLYKNTKKLEREITNKTYYDRSMFC